VRAVRIGGRSASAVALGVSSVPAARRVEAIWDAFVAAGGTTFDTAHHYGARNERRLGAWLSARGVRSHVFLIGKGAHTPACRPDAIAAQLTESLDRLGVEHVDLYLLHRDDSAVAVGEWVDALDAEVAAGRVGAVGVSNWSPERAAAFDAYARDHGRARLAALSNQLSLARMVEPPWAGCVGSREAGTLAWLERTQTPLVAWSAQARGWFSGRRHDAEVRRCWATADNRERRRRAEAVARRRQLAPSTVAVAWVIAQPFPTVAVCSPPSLAGLAQSLAADGVDLDDELCAWLDLRT
jgi:aryl-alcohol dehydrogenase-like predicted oxidoreductase